jgi:2,4-dienoyl-CoA reductase-like NADH-dependent reductase (Old Yellow Enzyme family)
MRISAPIRVGHLTLKHRLVMGPMGNWLWELNGLPKPAATDTLVARVKGGAAMVMIGAAQPHPDYENGPRPSFARDECIAAMRALVDAVHDAGAPIIAQLQHDGPGAKPAVSPSGVPCLTISSGTRLVNSRALESSEVAEMAAQFIAAALRAQAAGFDGIELAGQAGYLLSQFLSPRLNLRTDCYGGDAVRRMQLALEIIRGVRQRCGTHFVIGYALGVDDLKPGGMTPTESVPIALAFEAAGLDYLDIRVGTHETFAFSELSKGHNRYQSRSGIFEHGAMFKKVLHIPVFTATQGDYEPAHWEAALAAGQTDVIQIGKPMLADAALAQKVLGGKAADVRPCTLCMYCLDMSYVYGSTGTRSYCAVNYELGWEAEQAITMAATPRRVLVVGGGPAGLECARVAARRGHRVSLWERETEAGGALRHIAHGPGGDHFGALRDWLVRDCLDAGVAITYGRSASSNDFSSTACDCVVVATGANWRTPPAGAAPLAGAKRLNVLDVVAGSKVFGDVVIDGGAAAGIQAALMIGEAGTARSITLVASSAEQFCVGIAKLERNYLQSVLLPRYGVRVVIGKPLHQACERADVVIAAAPGAADGALADAARAAGLELHVIGAHTCNAVGDAIHAGARLAREL